MLSKLLSTKRSQHGGGLKMSQLLLNTKRSTNWGGLKMLPKLGGFEALWVRHGTEKAREDGVQVVTTNVATGSSFQPLQPSKLRTMAKEFPASAAKQAGVHSHFLG